MHVPHISVGRCVGSLMPAAPKNEIDTPSKRARLPARKNPYWLGVGGGRGGVSLGYRTSARGAGACVAKLVVDGERLEERLGDADDDGAPAGAMTYRAAVAAALDWSRRQTAAIEARAGSEAENGAQTVRSAVEQYTAVRKARSEEAGRIADGRLRRHVLGDDAFAPIPLAEVACVVDRRLASSPVGEWRQAADGPCRRQPNFERSPGRAERRSNRCPSLPDPDFARWRPPARAPARAHAWQQEREDLQAEGTGAHPIVAGAFGGSWQGRAPNETLLE